MYLCSMMIEKGERTIEGTEVGRSFVLLPPVSARHYSRIIISI